MGNRCENCVIKRVGVSSSSKGISYVAQPVSFYSILYLMYIACSDCVGFYENKIIIIMIIPEGEIF